MSSSWLWAGLVVILFCRPLFVGLGRTDLGNDESIYSFAVDRILETGDWLTPRSSPSETEAFLEKPPLKFWIVSLTILVGVLPHDEFGLRFWDAVFGGIAFLYVLSIGRRLGGPICGLVAVFALFVHRPLVMDHGLRSNNMEAALVLSYCGGVYHFLRWRLDESSSPGRLHAIAVSLYFVLAFMTKFVAALFLPGVLAASLLLGREGRARVRRDWRMWLLPACLAVVLISPWFLYQVHRSGAEVWAIMFGQHVVTRFTASLDVSHLQPWHFYFTTIAHQLRAWQMQGLVVLGLGLMLVRTWREDWTEGALILLWIVLPLSVMSLLTSKVYHYAYPMLPAIALAAGYGAARLFGFVWSFIGRFSGAVPARPVWLGAGLRCRGSRAGRGRHVAAGALCRRRRRFANGRAPVAFRAGLPSPTGRPSGGEWSRTGRPRRRGADAHVLLLPAAARTLAAARRRVEPDRVRKPVRVVATMAGAALEGPVRRVRGGHAVGRSDAHRTRRTNSRRGSSGSGGRCAVGDNRHLEDRRLGRAAAAGPLRVVRARARHRRMAVT